MSQEPINIWVRKSSVEQCLEKECPMRDEFFRQSSKYLNLVQEFDKLKNENYALKEAVSELLSQVSTLLSKPINESMNFLRSKAKFIPRILTIHYQIKPKGILVWFFTEEESIDFEMKIAELEVELMKVFHDLRFDFRVVPRYDDETDELMPENILVYHR